MKDREIALNPNKLVQYLKKPAAEFTRDDIIKIIEGNSLNRFSTGGKL